MTRQQGQSMTEFAVGMAVMTLLLLGSITLAGYQKVQRRMALAARQAAFQVAWLGSRADRANTVRRAADLHLDDPALVDPFGNRFVRTSDISVAAAMQSAPERAQSAARLMVEPLRAVGGFLGGNLDLAVNGLSAGSIAVTIQPNPALPEPFAGMSVELRQPFSQMADAWNSSGPGQVRSRTSALVPASALAELQMLWRPLLAPLALIEPSLSRLCLGIIEPDRIPEDRLGPGRTPVPGRCP
ncbi:MAG: TadE family protein [Pseudomonadota bacterium]